MRSITTLAMDDSLNAHDPFPLDPSLRQAVPSDSHFFTPHPPYPTSVFTIHASPAMDLQYILSPSVMLDGQQQPHSHVNQSHIVFQSQDQAVPSQVAIQLSSQPVPSTSCSGGIQLTPSLTRRPAEHVHPNPDDAIISFDSNTRSFPKPAKPSTPSIADPYAEDFLRDMLGIDKWETFSSRLFERRLGGKSKGKGKGKPGDDDDSKSGVSAIEFLVKVEVVKEILRTYVPHPYNPLKSLTHPYPRAPSGHVTLTRSTVLLLSGWSNTQFSYWARRAEAVSVLADHDSRLRAVGTALERRLRGHHYQEPEGEGENHDEAAIVTGKGLDAIVDEVKKRTGKSQFLRGKHSSLDPYGTAVMDLDPQYMPPPAQYAMPTFQAERYDHGTMRVLDLEQPPSLGPHPPPVSPPAPPKRMLKPLSPTMSFDTAGSRTASSDSQTPSLASPVTPSDLMSSQAESPRATRSSARKTAVASDDNVYHFPVSDSRSEVENSSAGGKRKPGVAGAASQKRPRTLMNEGES
ncbi:hypothetical protein K439DRAFT_100800 [Ramaria rubella]|nr:hypothetical protein K439DRAFT_100800 [Ramaria rubella]